MSLFSYPGVLIWYLPTLYVLCIDLYRDCWIVGLSPGFLMLVHMVVSVLSLPIVWCKVSQVSQMLLVVGFLRVMLLLSGFPCMPWLW
jgi:hypothetical protein